MFITNCVIKHLFHVVPGGHYERMFGAEVIRSIQGGASCIDLKLGGADVFSQIALSGDGSLTNTQLRDAVTTALPASGPASQNLDTRAPVVSAKARPTPGPSPAPR